MSETGRTGPLAGLRVLEFAGLAPAPFACMMLADLGAEVLTIERARADPAGARVDATDSTRILARGRQSVALDLKSPSARSVVADLLPTVDVLIEGFRPGVMERLELGPDRCLERNPRLVYGRMTGFGQDGPLSAAAGHDINYIALSGALHLIGPAGLPPVPPANLIGDFAGGGLLLAFGVLAALFERAHSGRGQVIDAAMLDGAALLTTFIHGIHAGGAWSNERGGNLLDGGTPYYDSYETKDGLYICIGAVEPQFYAELLALLDVDLDPRRQNDALTWPAMRRTLTELFRTRTRSEWCELLEGTDSCFAPVLSLADVADHPHNQARHVFIDVAGVRQPAPAPRFSRTPTQSPSAPPGIGVDGPAALRAWGVSESVLDSAVAENAVYLPPERG
jgi:alpha-methylacyl-CoA racemase